MRQYVLFTLGEEEFGVDVGVAVEVMRPVMANPLHDVPEFISGVATVREEVVPLIDMRKRFSLSIGGNRERLVLVRTSLEKVGLIVDDVQGISRFRDEDISRPPVVFRGLKSEFLTGLIKLNGKVLMLLDIENILDSEEKIVLEKAMEKIRGG